MDLEYTTIPTTELREHGSEIINRVAYGSEEVVLTRRGKPIAALISLEALDALHRLEDAEDVAAAAAPLEDVRLHGAIPFEEVKARFGLQSRLFAADTEGVGSSRAVAAAHHYFESRTAR